MFGVRGHAKFDVPSPTSRLWPPGGAVNQGSQACPGPVHLLLCVSQRGLLRFSPLCNDRSWADSMSSGAVCVGGKGQASQNFRVPRHTPVCFSQAAPRRRASCLVLPSCYPSCCASCCVLCVVLCVVLRASCLMPHALYFVPRALCFVPRASASCLCFVPLLRVSASCLTN